MKLSTYLFEEDKAATRDYNRTNHIHRCHKAKPDPMVVVKWFFVVLALIVLVQFTPWVKDAQAKNRASSVSREVGR